MMTMKGKESNGITQKLIFIFKAAKENPAHADRYAEVLEINEIPFAMIPVLSFEFVNKDVLISTLSQPNRLSAIILTSTRAVEAVVSALQGLGNGVKDLVSAIQCFVVGPATFDAAVAAGLNPEGKDCGNGTALADYISQKVKDPSKPLLFPCSNIRKESIPEILKIKGLTIAEVVAYETYPDDHIGDSIKEAVEAKGFPEYTVFFSPSGFKHVHAQAHTLSFPLQKTKIIALGPSTAAAVTDKGFKLHGTTERPDPESLLHLLQESMSRGTCAR